MGVVNRFQRLDDREFLDGLADVFAAPNAGGIDQGIAGIIALEIDIDAVAGRPGLIVDHHPVLSEQP